MPIDFELQGLSSLIAKPNQMDRILDKNQYPKRNYCSLSTDVVASHQKLGIILENKGFQKLKSQ